MAIAYTRVAARPDAREVITDITLDGSYGAGGYALDNKQLGMLSTPDCVEFSSYRHATATSSNVPVWDPANNKLLIFEGNTATNPLIECVAGDITSSHKVRATCKGNPIL